MRRKLFLTERENATACLPRKAPAVANLQPLVKCCFIYSQLTRNVRAVYKATSRQSQWPGVTLIFSSHVFVCCFMRSAGEDPCPKKKSGRGPPTSPTLRPRVLTPRDHFAHRGGGRGMIMHKLTSRCNRKLNKFLNIPFFRISNSERKQQ
jgi:hypothetical protein